MAKYRIKEIKQGDRVFYNVQEKWLFWWEDVTDFTCSIDGGYSEWAREFDLVSAQKYIKDQEIKTRII